MQNILKGSNERLSLGLDLLDLVLKFNMHKKLIFQLSFSKSFSELYILLHRINNSALAEKSTNCIIHLLKIQNRLASLSINAIIIVSKCRQLDKTCYPYFIIFLKNWLFYQSKFNCTNKAIVYRIQLFLSNQEDSSLVS